MASKFPHNYPVSAVCIVADAQRSPPGYELLMHSYDKKDDCDLWRESTMFKKITRYLCFTRAFNKAGSDNKVLVGVQILNEKDFPPTGFQTIEKTVDTSEKSYRKKKICIKMVDRDTAKMDAITDIILLTKTKRPPEGYTLAGDVNGILLCFKLGKIPVETQNFVHSTVPFVQLANDMFRTAPPPPIAGYPHPSNEIRFMKQTPPLPAIRTGSGTIKKADSTLVANSMADIKFQLNSKLLETNPTPSGLTVPTILYRSLVDIVNEYDYSFALERTSIQRLKQIVFSHSD